MKVFGWFLIIPGLIWAAIGAENIFTDLVAAWKFHRWEQATRSFWSNGLFYDVPGLSAAVIGAILVLWAHWREI